MFVIIAKVVNLNGEIEAVRVFNPQTKENRIISVGRVKQAVLNGQKIKGYKKVEVNDYLNATVRTHVVKEKSLTYNLNRVASLNGKGELRNAEDAKILVYCGWKGFAEMKRHYLYNYLGEVKLADKEQLLSLIKQGVVNGAAYKTDTDKIIISDDLNNEIK